MSINLQRLEVWLKRVVPAVVLGSLIFLGGAPKAKANDWDDCNRRIVNYKWQLHEAIEDHGYDSRQSKHWRHELREEYEKQDKLRRKYHYDQWGYDQGRRNNDYDRDYYRNRDRRYRDSERYRDTNQDRYYWQNRDND
jgi:hypothetical protein